jgi:pimeloyl-ACP methyl ester carboxylesterase
MMAYWKADDGSQIYYEIHGRSAGGPSLLLLPGLLGSISVQWRNFVEPLAKDYRLLLVDLRGHGRSENQANGLLPDKIVQDLLGLLDHLNVESIHVAGYNLGGYLGLMLHLYEPRRVQTLLMHATKFYWMQPAADRMSEQLEPDVISDKAPAYASQLALQHGAARWRSLVRQAADLINYLSLGGLSESGISKVQCPVLVSVGDCDELVPVREAHRLSRELPTGSLLVLPGVHHPIQGLGLVPMLQVMQSFHK